ncbi:hypothetical protein [Paraurantiacibacter namhicola]|uniref:Lipoprotein n=1 Tax=Paraurantiacibacter namhicola TaxID=645517 RepID=A0A1C7D972_9SPHN|nr:hypothetical protein [Paraurantiacibacter namhicola]ANU07853.1 hypothetical protein A6F65_01552 [Paraurantiacibacter namhicola]
MIRTTLLTLAAAATLTGCVRYNIDDRVAHARLGEVAVLDGLSIAPIEVIEDSRCPEGVECVWAGRLVVSAQLTDSTGGELREIALGETFEARGRSIEFFSARPKAEEGLKPLTEDYRFGFRRAGD